MKETFVHFRIKKKVLESDMDFAFTLFKRIIVGLGTENKLKNSAVDNTDHIFPPPAEREKLGKQAETQKAKINNNTAKKKPFEKSKVKTKFVDGKSASGIPQPPSPPPIPNFVPNAVPKTSDSANSTTAVNNSAVDKPVDLASELINMKLKPVNSKDVNKANKANKDVKDVNLGGAGKNFLQDALHQAIIIRRQNLRLHDDDNEDDDDDDDWN